MARRLAGLVRRILAGGYRVSRVSRVRVRVSDLEPELGTQTQFQNSASMSITGRTLEAYCIG